MNRKYVKNCILTIFALTVCASPGLTASHDEIKAFTELAMIYSPNNESGKPSVVKWTSPVVVGVYFMSSEFSNGVRNIIKEINAATNHPITFGANNINIPVIGIDELGETAFNKYEKQINHMVINRKDMEDLLMVPWRSKESCRGNITSSSGEAIHITWAIIIVRQSHKTDDVLDCAADALVRAVGLISGRYSPSLKTMFLMKNVSPPYLLRDDISALRILYSEEIKSGSTKNEVMNSIKRLTKQGE